MNFLAQALAWIRGLPANEPVLVGAAVTSIGTLLVSLNVPHLTALNVAEIASGMSVAVGLVQRAAVSPLANLIAPANSNQGAKQ